MDTVNLRRTGRGDATHMGTNSAGCGEPRILAGGGFLAVLQTSPLQLEGLRRWLGIR
jgi:hypothetical protein